MIALYRGRSRTSREVKAIAAQHLARVERKMRELQSVRGALADLIEHCRGNDRPDCPISEESSGEAEAAKPPR